MVAFVCLSGDLYIIVLFSGDHDITSETIMVRKAHHCVLLPLLMRTYEAKAGQLFQEVRTVPLDQPVFL